MTPRFELFLLLVLAFAGMLAALAPTARAQEDTPTAQTVYTAEAVRADFDQLYAGLAEAHYDLFAATPRAVFDQQHSEMRASFDHPMQRWEIQRDFQTFAALARHGHARLGFPMDAFEAYRAAGGRALPIGIRVFEGGVYLASVDGPARGLVPGDEILSLNGQPNAIWMPRLTRHISAETPVLAHTLLQFYLPGLVWLEWPELDAVVLQVRHADGRTQTVDVPFLSRADLAETAETEAATFSLDGREARMIDAEIAYLRPGPFYNDASGESMWSRVGFTDFIDASFRRFLDAGAQALILDLRDNPGGDNSFSDPVIAWFADRPFRFASDFRIRVSPQTTASNQARLDAQPADEAGVSAIFADLYARRAAGDIVHFDLPDAQPRSGDRFEGAVYVLINRYSFSNAVSVAALIQDYGFGIVAGEATADMATTYGAMEQFALARSGLMVGYPKAHIIRPNGEARPHPVTPDLELDFPVLRGAHDTVLTQLVSRIRHRDD